MSGCGYSVDVLREPGYIHSRVFNMQARVLLESLDDLGWLNPNGREIVLGANIVGMFPHLVDKISTDAIIYNLEAGSSPWMRNPEYLSVLRSHAVLDYDLQNVEWLRTHGIDARHCPIRYHKCLERLDEDVERTVDVVFYGSVMERRIPILKAIELMGLKVKWLGHDNWNERDHWIAQSKIVLNCHSYDNAPFEMARVGYLLANRACVVSEGPRIRALEKMVIFADGPQDIATTCYLWSRDPEMCRDWGRRARAAYMALPHQAEVLRQCLPDPTTGRMVA